MAPAPRNIYNTQVDFAALARQDPAFANKLKKNKQLDFSDPGSVLQLTKSLLRRDFDLDIELPDDRLCPPVPNRFNYILWLQDLLDATSPDYRESYDPDRKVIGIDIGTGASCIYPLLATRQRPNWSLLATEIDSKSFEYAQRNVSTNGLGDRIKILKISDSDRNLVPDDVFERFEKLDFLMTNPPFNCPTAPSTVPKSHPPSSVCTGAPTELLTPGGETSFVDRLITQSAHPHLKHTVQWWSSMLGKLASVAVVVDRLKAAGCRNWAVKEFNRGQGRTRRWAVAWSWGGLRAGVEVARGWRGKARAKRGEETHGKIGEDQDGDGDGDDDGGDADGSLLPFPSEFDFELEAHHPATTAEQMLGQKIDSELSNLDLQWQWKQPLRTGLGIAWTGDCWSRKARRKKQRKQNSNQLVQQQQQQQQQQKNHEPADDEDMLDADDGDSDSDREPELVFKIHVWHISHSKDLEQQGGKAQGEKAGAAPAAPVRPAIHVHVRWLQGQDHVLFESFCGWLKRRLSVVVVAAPPAPPPLR